ncbi:MAG: glycosyltransferase [Candidatus Atribacteria bacterium]|nr:glycosyltransferase [Candidatus Atribacteria bacterium]
MNDSPLVSVVIPAYNASRWIAETLESVLAQDFTDYEIIVVDSSEDDTSQVVAGFGERVCCIRVRKEGTGSARNVGIRAARGEYIAFVDADDLWVKEKLRLQVDLLKRIGLAWVYCDALAFDNESGKPLFRLGRLDRQYAGEILGPLFHANFIPSPTPVIQRSIFENVGNFFEGLDCEDWDMWLRIAARYPVGLISQPLAYYRIHATSKTGTKDAQVILRGELDVIERAIAREPVRLGSLRRRVIAERYAVSGIGYAGMGRTSPARAMFVQAMRYNPSNPLAYLFWLSTWFGGNLLHRIHLLNVARRGYRLTIGKGGH